MASRSGRRVPEGYPQAYSLNDDKDPFGSSNTVQRSYYDQDPEEYGRNRDTYASDSSHGPHDGERYLDNTGYDSYSE